MPFDCFTMLMQASYSGASAALLRQYVAMIGGERLSEKVYFSFSTIKVQFKTVKTCFEIAHIRSLIPNRWWTTFSIGAVWS